jgi:hypothetical protein
MRPSSLKSRVRRSMSLFHPSPVRLYNLSPFALLLSPPHSLFCNFKCLDEARMIVPPAALALDQNLLPASSCRSLFPPRSKTLLTRAHTGTLQWSSRHVLKLEILRRYVSSLIGSEYINPAPPLFSFSTSHFLFAQIQNSGASVL